MQPPEGLPWYRLPLLLPHLVELALLVDPQHLVVLQYLVVELLPLVGSALLVDPPRPVVVPRLEDLLRLKQPLCLEDLPLLLPPPMPPVSSRRDVERSWRRLCTDIVLGPCHNISSRPSGSS